METVRQAIKTERRARGWSQGKLAEMIGKSTQYISQIERGEDSLSPEKADEILKHFGLQCKIVVIKSLNEGSQK